MVEKHFEIAFYDEGVVGVGMEVINYLKNFMNECKNDLTDYDIEDLNSVIEDIKNEYYYDLIIVKEHPMGGSIIARLVEEEEE